MIQESIQNQAPEEITDIVDRDLSENGILNITAFNLNPCAIDESYTSKTYEECEGVYLKWFNNYGGWSYHLFYNAYDRNIDVNEKGKVQRYYSNRATAVEDMASIGFEVEQEWELSNIIPYDNELHRLEVESIKYSPVVMLYIGQQHTGEQKWKRVHVVDDSWTTKENSLLQNDLSFKIQFENLNSY